jgi:hypothetical protein
LEEVESRRCVVRIVTWEENAQLHDVFRCGSCGDESSECTHSLVDVLESDVWNGVMLEPIQLLVKIGEQHCSRWNSRGIAWSEATLVVGGVAGDGGGGRRYNRRETVFNNSSGNSTERGSVVELLYQCGVNCPQS